MRERSTDPDFESGARHLKSTRARSSVPTDYTERALGTDTDTTVIVPGIAGDSHPARGMRLRLRFDSRELLLDEHHSSITIGRAEDNDLVVKGHLSSRVHARIVIGRSNFVLIDQSTNGTFVQTGDGEKLLIHHDNLRLKGQGMIGLGCLPEQGSEHTIHFTCEEIAAG